MLFDRKFRAGKVLLSSFSTGVLFIGLLVNTSVLSQQERRPSEPARSPAGICGERQDKLQCVQEFVAEHPTDLELRRGLVMMLIDQREFQRALEEIDAFLLQDPSDFGMRRARVSLLESLGDPDAARVEREQIRVMSQEGWDKLLSEDAPDPRALLQAASVAHVRQKLKISQRLFERYFAIVPRPPLPVLRNYASLLHSQGNHQDAIDTLTIALNRAPENDFENRLTLLEYRQVLRKGTRDEAGAAADAARYKEVKALYKARRADEAKRRWRALLGSPQQSDPPTILTEANNAAAAREFETARKLYERFFELTNSTIPSAVLGYARVLLGLEEYNSALEALMTLNRETLGNNPSLQSNFLRTRALIKERMGDTDGSRADWLEHKELLEDIKAENTKNKAEGLSSSKTSSGRSGGVNPQ